MSNKVKKLLTARFGVVSPDSIEDYIKNGGYASLKKALGMDPEAIITELSRPRGSEVAAARDFRPE